MKKHLRFTLTVMLLCCLLLSACGGGASPASEEPAKIQSVALLGEAMVEAADGTETLSLLDEKIVGNLYDFDPALTDDYQVYYNLRGNSPEEISVFHAISAESKTALKEMLQDRLETVEAEMSISQERYPNDYGDLMDMVNTAKILEQGDYLAFVIAKDSSAVEKAFKACF